MEKKSRDTRWLTSVALMAAIVILLANTPLGMIHLHIIKATTVHIPVILGAILLGPAAGAVLGAVFGICSMISNKAVWISVGCRIMIGVVAGWVWILLKKMKVNRLAALPVTGFIGSMTNTVFVMGSIYLMLAREYAQARSVAVDAVWGLILGTVTASGVPEAIAAAILVALIGKVLLKVLGK